jgi:hypothetical protein
MLGSAHFGHPPRSFFLHPKSSRWFAEVSSDAVAPWRSQSSLTCFGERAQTALRFLLFGRLIADCHTAVINDGVDLAVWRAMGSRDGEESVSYEQ